MEHELQKASLWKRVAAGLFDLILLVVLATGGAFLLSVLLGYDAHSTRLEQTYDAYESQYGITFDISTEEYEKLTGEQKASYDTAYEALIADEEAMYTYNLVINLMLLITTGGILIATVLLEFILPLILGNGQTLGKKIFALCLVRTDSVKMNNMQLFARSILGKFAIETMIPVYVVLMTFFNAGNIFSTLLLAALVISQLVIVCVTKNNSLLHDLIAGTSVADFGSQRIFRSTEDLIAYQKRVAADRASRQTY